jgi:hypothetical protein
MSRPGGEMFVPPVIALDREYSALELNSVKPSWCLDVITA